MSRKKTKRAIRKISQTLPEIDARDANDLPSVRVGLRPDGALCVILPGLHGHSRSPIVNDVGLAAALRRILSAQQEAQLRRIGYQTEPTQDMLRHETHTSYDPRCPHCQYEMAAEGLESAPVKIKRVETRKIARTGDVDVQRRVGLHYCACGWSGDFKAFAAHMAQHNPVFPKQPPEGFPHREVSTQRVADREARKRLREEGLAKIANGEVKEIDL